MLFENGDRIVHTGYYLPKVKIKDYNVMIDRQNVFDQSVKSDMRRYDNSQKITTHWGDDYTTGCVPDYPYFKEQLKLITIEISKELVFYCDSKAKKLINFTLNLNQAESATMFFIV